MLLPTILTFFLPFHAGDGTQRSTEPSVLEVYDLTTALPGAMHPGTIETLLPYLGGNDRSGEEEEGAMGGADVVIDLLRALNGDEFDYEGRSIHMESSGRLIVQAPPSLQARTKALLSFLESVFGASLELRIDAVELAEGQAETIPALLAPADADKLIARGGGSGVRSWRLRVSAGDTAMMDLSRVTSMVTDYDIEIAQATAIADPIVHDVAVGLRLFARASPSAGGTWLSLILRRGDPLGEVVDRRVPIAAHVTTQERINGLEVSTSYQTVEVLNRSLAIDTYLPESRVLAIQSSFLAGNRRGEILLVRRASGSLPIFKQIALDKTGESAGGKLLYLNAESIVPPRIALDHAAIPSAAMPSVWRMSRFREGNREFGIWAGFAAEPNDVLRDLLGGNDEDLEIRNVGPCLLLTRHARSKRPDTPILPARDASGPDILERYAPPARLAQVSITLRRSGTTAPVARCSMPIRFGESGCMVLATEAIEVADWDVEVAQAASVADSQMRIAFDGIAVRARPTMSLSGDLVVDVGARAHVRRGKSREFELGVPSLGTIDQSTHDQLFARENLVFGKAEGAPKRFVLGDAAEGSTSGSLSFEIEAVELK
ncbi:MAG: hypothetical protein ACKVXR_09360 [Planctomycetota bacterium]